MAGGGGPAADDRPGAVEPGRDRKPRAAGLHERLDEVELIISGAVVFALTQLPARVDQAYLALDPRLAGTLDVVAFMGFYYVKLILYTLIFTLVVHLGVRAFWVALEGLDSVFPGGIRWSELKQGPITGRVLPEAMPSIRSMAERADALASVLFSAAFSLVLVFAASIVVAGVLGVLVLGAIRLLPLEMDPGTLLLWIVLAFVLVFAAPPLVDRALGPRLDPDGRAYRLLERGVRVYSRVVGASFYGPIQFTLSSHLGSWRAGVAIMASVFALIGFFMVKDVFVPLDRLVLSPSAALPQEAGSLGVEPRYYEAYRSPWAAPRYPSVESEIVTDERPWVRLFVPFRPGTDDDGLERVCPGLDVRAGGAVRLRRAPVAPPDSTVPEIRESLRCVASLWRVELDGAPLEEAPGSAGGDPVFMRHPGTGIAGVARYLDVRRLAPGRHVLTVTRNPAALDDHDEDPPDRHEIVFWR